MIHFGIQKYTFSNLGRWLGSSSQQELINLETSPKYSLGISNVFPFFIASSTCKNKQGYQKVVGRPFIE